MGYFRARISRHRCASHVDAALRRQARELSDWIEAPAVRPARLTTYLRFAVGRIHTDSRQQLGVFQAVYDLRRTDLLSRTDRATANELLGWFGKNLVAPSIDDASAIFWYRSDAADCIDRTWEMIRLLKAHDHIVWMSRSDSPGRVIYRDVHQVAAVPWRDRGWRRRPV